MKSKLSSSYSGLPAGDVPPVGLLGAPGDPHGVRPVVRGAVVTLWNTV